MYVMYVLDCHVEAHQKLYQNLKSLKLSNLQYDMEVLARMKISSPRTNSVHHRHYLQKASEYRLETYMYDQIQKLFHNSKTPLSASPNLLIASIISSSSAIANVARKNISG